MRLERLSNNKFKIFLTFDDLIERGLTKDDLWYDLPKVHQLFHDMMFEASDELGLELEGNLMVKVHLLQAQGMLIVVTQNEEVEDENYIEMKVTLDESQELIFVFESFEHIISLCEHLQLLDIDGGTIYLMDEQYYMQLQEDELNGNYSEHIIALMSEFSSPSTVTSYRLKEYGKGLIEQNAVKQIAYYFL